MTLHTPTWLCCAFPFCAAPDGAPPLQETDVGKEVPVSQAKKRLRCEVPRAGPPPGKPQARARAQACVLGLLPPGAAACGIHSITRSPPSDGAQSLPLAV